MIKLFFQKIRLLSNARKEPYSSFYKILGFYPDNIDYYQLAISHRSLSVFDDSGQPLSNERLEFLGDAVLNSIITDILFRKYPQQPEGFLTNTRSKIVKRETLNKIAMNIGLDKIIKISKTPVSYQSKNLYGNAFEALIGAVYLDYGYKKCKLFFEKKILSEYLDIDELAAYEINFKSKLIEWCQKRHQNPEFVLLKNELINPNIHQFQTRLLIDGEPVSEGTGSSRKESEQNACYNALLILEN